MTKQGFRRLSEPAYDAMRACGIALLFAGTIVAPPTSAQASSICRNHCGGEIACEYPVHGKRTGSVGTVLLKQDDFGLFQPVDRNPKGHLVSLEHDTDAGTTVTLRACTYGFDPAGQEVDTACFPDEEVVYGGLVQCSTGGGGKPPSDPCAHHPQNPECTQK